MPAPSSKPSSPPGPPGPLPGQFNSGQLAGFPGKIHPDPKSEHERDAQSYLSLLFLLFLALSLRVVAVGASLALRSLGFFRNFRTFEDPCNQTKEYWESILGEGSPYLYCVLGFR
jgi:hypothetical protein